MDHFSLLRGSSGSHSIWLWKCGKISRKTSPEKVEVWNVGIGASSGKMGKCMEMPCFQEIRALTLVVWNWWITVAWGIFSQFPQIGRTFHQKLGCWKMIIHPMHGKVVCGSWAGRGRASETSDSSPTRCRGKGWIDSPLGHFRNHAEHFFIFFWIMSYVWCNWVHGQTLLQTLKI